MHRKSRILDTKVCPGMDGLLELAAMPDTEILVTAIVGMLGIRPTIEAIRAGKDIALANKETLVTAGHLIMPMAKEYGVKILPVDSEHSAIFQSLNGEHRKEVHKLADHGIRRTVSRKKERRPWNSDAGRYFEASELGDGTEDHGGFRDSGE